MGCVLSRLTALALSSLGNGAGSAVGCLPGLALGLEFQLMKTGQVFLLRAPEAPDNKAVISGDA